MNKPQDISTKSFFYFFGDKNSLITRHYFTQMYTHLSSTLRTE